MGWNLKNVWVCNVWEFSDRIGMTFSFSLNFVPFIEFQCHVAQTSATMMSVFMMTLCDDWRTCPSAARIDDVMYSRQLKPDGGWPCLEHPWKSISIGKEAKYQLVKRRQRGYPLLLLTISFYFFWTVLSSTKLILLELIFCAYCFCYLTLVLYISILLCLYLQKQTNFSVWLVGLIVETSLEQLKIKKKT